MLYLQYGVYDSPVPSMFIRSGQLGQPNPLPSRQTVRNYKLEQCLTVVLKSEIGHGATGEVLRGTLEVEASACGWLDVAVKLALASGQRDALRNEYKMYHLLKKSGVTTGITTPLGLFDDVEDEACALVMPYAGIPLADVPELVLPISSRCQLHFACHSYPDSLTHLGQENCSCDIEGHTSSKHTARRYSFGERTCGGFRSYDHRFRSIPSVL